MVPMRRVLSVDAAIVAAWVVLARGCNAGPVDPVLEPRLPRNKWQATPIAQRLLTGVRRHIAPAMRMGVVTPAIAKRAATLMVNAQRVLSAIWRWTLVRIVWSKLVDKHWVVLVVVCLCLSYLVERIMGEFHPPQYTHVLNSVGG